MRAAKLVLAMFAVGCFAVALAPASTAQQRTARKASPPYSRAEVDQQMNQLRQDLLTQVATMQALQNELNNVYSKTDVDKELGSLRSMIPQQGATRSDLDAAISKLDDETKAREQQLRGNFDDRIMALEAGKPAASPRTAIIVAACAVILSLGLGLASLAASLVIGRRARADALAIAEQAGEDARFLIRTGRAEEYLAEWDKLELLHADAIASLEGNAITDAELINIVKVANWHERLADAALSGRLNLEILNRAALGNHADAIWRALENGRDPRLTRLRAVWDRLNAYVTARRATP